MSDLWQDPDNPSFSILGVSSLPQTEQTVKESAVVRLPRPSRNQVRVSGRTIIVHGDLEQHIREVFVVFHQRRFALEMVDVLLF